MGIMNVSKEAKPVLADENAAPGTPCCCCAKLARIITGSVLTVLGLGWWAFWSSITYMDGFSKGMPKDGSNRHSYAERWSMFKMIPTFSLVGTTHTESGRVKGQDARHLFPGLCPRMVFTAILSGTF